MTTASVVQMPKKSGFSTSRGRKSLYGAPMIGKQVSMTSDMWGKVEDKAVELGDEEGREISGAEVVRLAVDAWFSGEESQKEKPHSIPMRGVILGDDFEKIQMAPAHATVEVPSTIGADCYAILVLGKQIETDDGIIIPSGHYAIFCPQEKFTPGALVDVAWDGEDSKSSPAFKKYIPRGEDAIFKPVASAPVQQTITKKKGEFKIRGAFVDTWDGTNSEKAQ